MIYDFIPICQDRVATAEAIEATAEMVQGIQISLEAAKVEALSQMENWHELDRIVEVCSGHTGAEIRV